MKRGRFLRYTTFAAFAVASYLTAAPAAFAQMSQSQPSSLVQSAPLAGAVQQLMQSPFGTQTTQQGLASDTIQEMQKVDPDAAKAFSDAIQKGDFETAKSIYDEFKQNHPDAVMVDTSDMDPKLLEDINRAIKKGDFKTAQKLFMKYQKLKRQKGGMISPDMILESEQSIFERTLSGDFPKDILKADLVQFGYDLFQKATLPQMHATTTPVGPDYIIGPGDQLVLTLWGTTEGIYNLLVSKEGRVTLPKVGVVSIAGVRFGEIENTLRRHLSRYYSNFNLSVAIGKLKTITVYIVGEVATPGSYNLNSLASLYSALVTAGGPTKKGSLRNIQVLRGGKVIKSIDLYDFLLKGDRSQDLKLQHEDTIFIPIIGQIVGVAGTVYRPGIYEMKGSETVGDAIRMAGGIMPIGLSSQLQVVRYADNERKVIIDLNIAAKQAGDLKSQSALNDPVRNMDVIKVSPVYDKTWDTVNLEGDVQHPGDYEWHPGLKLKEIIDRGQLLPTSDLRSVEIIRLTSDFMDRKIIPVELDDLLKGDENKDIPLMPKDEIKIYTTFRPVEKVSLKGEVVRPEEYEVYKGERLSDLLRRAGGFTREAYPYGMVFKRKDVKAVQSKNLQSFLSRMQSQILQSAAGSAGTAVSGEDVNFAKSQMQINQSVLDNLKNMQEQSEGRIAINITENIDSWAGTKDDLLLQDGDSIVIPKKPQEVIVMGEVYSPGAQVYVPGLRVRDYLEQTGGFTTYSDSNQIFVVQANGFAYSGDSPSVGNIQKVTLNPGDTIIVPQKIERYAAMRFTKDIIDILFKTAVTIATLTVIF